MERPNTNEVDLKVFNTAKLVAENILFPRMKLFQECQNQADFGASTLDKACDLSEEIRHIQRFNALKGMAECTYNLLLSISSTIRIKNNRDEIEQLDLMLKFLEDLTNTFYDNREKFFTTTYKNNQTVEEIDRKEFQRVKKIINSCYINVEILMTRNKLLFADANDEYSSDAEILDQLKKEYVEG